MEQDDVLLRVNDLVNNKGQRGILGVGRTALHLMLERGEFPAPLYVGRCPTWPRSVVKEWMERRRGAGRMAA